jgi:DNA primase
VAIPDDEVAQVRAATDIVALIGEQVALRQQGRRFVGLCPFHAEKTPSFSVNAQEGLYYCFGCRASGDAITFVRATEAVDFAEAVRRLAARAGITLHEDRGAGTDSRWRVELLDAMERAVAWYHERLVAARDAGPAREYLRSRGYDGGVVRRFRLGWAPTEWDALARALALPERVFTATGLGFVNRRGRLQDAFRGRVIFPICDPSGRPVALGGRILPPRPGHEAERAEPKYKNTQETAIYAKRRTLYGLHWAKQEVVATGEVVVCEGYTDVIGFYQAGIQRAVATCGTALAEEHFRLLRNFARRIVLAYDADAAGEMATARVYEWERRHEVDVAVAALPAGSDPADLATRDPAALVAAVASSRPFLQYRLERVLEQGQMTSAEGRAKAAEAAIQVIAEHPDELVRDQYVMTVSDHCRIEPDLVRRRVEEVRRRGPTLERRRPRRPTVAETPADGGDTGVAPARPLRPRPDPSSRPGLEALRLAVHQPEAAATRLEPALFGDELQRRAYLALCSAESLHEAIDSAPADVADLLRRVAVEEPVVPDDASIDPVEAVVSQLLRVAVRRELSELQAWARTNPEQLDAAGAESARVRRWLEELDDPSDDSGAAHRLLAWLLDRRRED